jgi:hypothetical protein
MSADRRDALMHGTPVDAGFSRAVRDAVGLLFGVQN